MRTGLMRDLDKILTDRLMEVLTDKQQAKLRTDPVPPARLGGYCAGRIAASSWGLLYHRRLPGAGAVRRAWLHWRGRLSADDVSGDAALPWRAGTTRVRKDYLLSGQQEPDRDAGPDGTGGNAKRPLAGSG